jgi:hypothetical protein
MVDDDYFFVIYSFPTQTPSSWKYGKFPKGWSWVGAGSTVPFKLDKTGLIPKRGTI